jgi:hypothetical protein
MRRGSQAGNRRRFKLNRNARDPPGDSMKIIIHLRTASILKKKAIKFVVGAMKFIYD